MNVKKICDNIYTKNITNLFMLPTALILTTNIYSVVCENNNGDGEYG